MLFLLGLFEQFMSHFFQWSIILTTKLSAEGTLSLKTLAGKSSRVYNKYQISIFNKYQSIDIANANILENTIVFETIIVEVLETFSISI